MVAGFVTVRQDRGVRRSGLALALAILAGGALGGGAAGAGAAGRVERVVAPRRIEVFVPSGRFLMGVDEDASLVAVQQCELAYPAVAGTHPTTGKPVGFCSVAHE